MKRLILSAIVCIIFSCKNNTTITSKKRETNVSVVKINNDTTIRLNKDRLLLFTTPTNFGDGRIRYKDRVLLNNKRDTIGKYSDGVSELLIDLSPNKQYLITDGVDLVYVHRTETDSILDDEWWCFLIDLKNGKTINFSQSDCVGEWNSKNQWISENKIIFNPIKNSND